MLICNFTSDPKCEQESNITFCINHTTKSEICRVNYNAKQFTGRVSLCCVDITAHHSCLFTIATV